MSAKAKRVPQERRLSRRASKPHGFGLGKPAAFLKCWAETWQEAIALCKILPGHLYRGQADAKWALTTSLERTAARFGWTGDLQNRETYLLERFCRRAHHFIKDPPKRRDILEWLALMQHHGAPTRLLDFTHSFYVATYFALESAEQDAAVWCIRDDFLHSHTSNTLSGDKTILDLAQESRVVVGDFLGKRLVQPVAMAVEPFRMSERMAAQQGIFVLPGDLSLPFEKNLSATAGIDLRFDDARTIPAAKLLAHSSADSLYEVLVFQIVLPKKIHNEAVWDLNAMNVNAASLFPGLDGLARSLHLWFRDAE